MTAKHSGPLAGIRVVEFAGLGPAPFTAMLLSDMGADVLRIDRPGTPDNDRNILNRGRASLVLDLKNPRDRERLQDILAAADVLIEGFRPGVMERNGLGPDEVRSFNPRLVYLRVTGWGQDGPMAQKAGHDINFIAIAGALAPIGPVGQPPVPPLNLVGDFGGGALFAAMGAVAALYEREKSGLGQVIDAAMVDGAANLMAMYLSHRQGGRKGTGLAKGDYFLDGSAPFYRCYECADGRFVALGAIEPKFWQTLIEVAGIAEALPQDPPTWPETAARLEALFRTRSRDEWVDLLAGHDACFSPVLAPDELENNEHLDFRRTYLRQEGLLQPAPAPRFSRSASAIAGAPVRVGAGGEAMADTWLKDNHPKRSGTGGGTRT